MLKSSQKSLTLKLLSVIINSLFAQKSRKENFLLAAFFYYLFSKRFFGTLQMGQVKLSESSSKGVSPS